MKALALTAVLFAVACDAGESPWASRWEARRARHDARLAQCVQHCGEAGCGRGTGGHYRRLVEVGGAAWCGCHDGSGTFLE